MFSIEETLYHCLMLGWGQVYVMGPALRESFLKKLIAAASPRKVEILSVDDQDPKAVHKRVTELAASGDVAVLMADRSFPDQLAHIAYVFNKDDGLVMPDGGTRRNLAKSFCLVCCLTPAAWRSVHPHQREDLARVTVSGGHAFGNSLADGAPLSSLEGERRKALENPLKALRDARGSAERQQILLDVFPPRRDGDSFNEYDEDMLKLIEEITALKDRALQQDFLDAVVRQKDLYLASEALSREWPCPDSTMSLLVAEVTSTGSLGGQRQFFWELVRELAERGDRRIRSFAEQLIEHFDPAVAALLDVLAKMRPWPELVECLVALSSKTEDPLAVDYARTILRAASDLGLFKGCTPGITLDDRQHYLEVAMRIIPEDSRLRLQRELEKLVAFQIAIQDCDVGSYPKSILTFQRAVESLKDSGTWIEAVEFNHLGSVSPTSDEHRLMEETIAEIEG